MTASAEQKLAELTAILGDDPVGRAKALNAENERLRHENESAEHEAESLRAALAEKDALLAELTDADDWLRQLLAAQDRIKELEAETARLQARVAELESIDGAKIAAFDAAVAKYGRWPPPPEARFVDGRWEP